MIIDLYNITILSVSTGGDWTSTCLQKAESSYLSMECLIQENIVSINHRFIYTAILMLGLSIAWLIFRIAYRLTPKQNPTIAFISDIFEITFIMICVITSGLILYFISIDPNFMTLMTENISILTTG